MVRFASKLVPIALAVLMAAAFDSAEAQRRTNRSYSSAGSSSRTVSARFGNARSYSYRGRSQQCSQRVWIPGRYESIQRRRWVEGSLRREWVPDRYETRYQPCGTPYEVLVERAHWAYVRDPGYWKTYYVKVWRPGYWS